MDANKQEKMLIWAIVISALLAVGAGFFMYRFDKESAEVEQKNKVLTNQLNEMREQVKATPALREERNIAQGQLEEAELILPNDEEFETFNEKLNVYKIASGVTIKNYAIGREPQRRAGGAQALYGEIVSSVEITGDFFQFVEFLNMLENYERLIRVDEFNVKPDKDGVNKINIDFTMFKYVGAGG